MNIAAGILACISLLMSALLFVRIKAPAGFLIWFPKLAAGTLSPLWAVAGLLGAVLGLFGQAPLATVAGGVGMGCMVWYIWSVTKPHPGFEQAFGADWKQCIPRQREAHLLKRRWMGLLLEQGNPAPCFKQNISFATIPGTRRELLCDLWQPPVGTAPSGLAVIYFHGSAWYMLDKDFGTRPFFRHLAGQGHIVMDVAYRLCPEVDITGMIGDIKRAVAWMKENSPKFGVNPERIILAGGSAGGHLSMLAGYAPNHPALTPEELRLVDLTVRGIVSYYGPSDLNAVYNHTNQQRLVGLPKVPTGPAFQGEKNARDAGRLDILLGGHPFEAMDMYDLASPVTHVHPGCPPTLLIQGEQDLITPVGAARSLHKKLVDAGVPAINVVFPCTDHGFDLLLPPLSPAYQSALFDVDRFLALLA
ncbi:MAG: alpha/beta hydrolase [Chloroflexi bacterium]|nr:MAG: alpha/beta hydrolase [Chloroflexota bacterium]